MNVRTLKIYSIILCLVGCHLQAISQDKPIDKWNLNSCIRYAITHNLNNRLNELNQNNSAIAIQQARLNRLPSLNGISEGEFSFGRSLDPNTNDYTNTKYFYNEEYLYSTTTLFHGFVLQNTIDYYKFINAQSKWTKINAEDELAFSILSDFYDIHYYQGTVAITQEQLKLAEENLRKAKAQVQLGLKAESDFATIQADLEENKLSLIQAQNNLADAKASLKQEMNLSPTDSLAIKEDSIPLMPPSAFNNSPDSLFTYFINYSPAINEKRQALMAAKKQLSVTKGNYWPKLVFEAELTSYYTNTNKEDDGHITSFHNQLQQNENKYLLATLSIPIFNHKETRNNVRKARIAQTEAEIKLNQAKQELYYKISNTARKLTELYREKIQASRQVQANELAYKTAQRKYDEGLIGIIELMTSKSKLATARNKELSATLKWQIKYRMINFYKGIRFWEANTSN